MSELFLRILNVAVIAGWLVLAVLVARILLKKAPAWIKCALWAVVGLRLLWPFEIQSTWSLIPSVQTLPQEELYSQAPQLHTGLPMLNSAINPGFAQSFQPDPSNSVNPLQVAVGIAAVVWVLGMAVMAVYMGVSYLRLRRRVRCSMPAGEGVYLCDGIDAPFILGLIRPRIYLPSDLPEDKWSSILAHERAHLARRDHWWKPLGFLLLTVFWFHPLLWLAYFLLCRDVELACDERVIQHLSAEEKQTYSQTLLECSVPGKWITACPLAFGETGVKQRIKAVLHYKKPTVWILIAAILIGVVLVACFLTDPLEKPPENIQQVYEQCMKGGMAGDYASFSKNIHYENEAYLQIAEEAFVRIETYEIKSWEKIHDELWAVTTEIRLSYMSCSEEFTHFVGVVDGNYQIMIGVHNIPNELKKGCDFTRYIDPNGIYIEDLVK